jgi:predicted O-methyltransferase YrrM
MHIKRIRVNYGSHLPLLIKVIESTKGGVIELGSGFYSTMMLHWMCRKRTLLTCESSAEYYRFMLPFSSENHMVKLINDWEKCDDISLPWSVAFVDLSPAKYRGIILPKLTHVDYVVVHDTEKKYYDKYGYSDDIMSMYQYQLNSRRYNTSILSNKHDNLERFYQ